MSSERSRDAGDAAAHYLEQTVTEFRKLRTLAERALAQPADERLFLQALPGGVNSVAIIVKHLGGNLASRWTDFLTTDGEKPWRDRESEFGTRSVTRAELLAKWEEGWRVLFATLSTLDDDALVRSIAIRGEPHTVLQALHRSLAHAAYHVGQIVLLSKSFRGDGWKSLTIPRGGIPGAR